MGGDGDERSEVRGSDARGISATGCWRPSRASVPTWWWASTRSTARCRRRSWRRIRRSDYADEAEMKAACYREFLSALLPAVADEACAVKIQIAYFEALGAPATRSYEEMVALAQSTGLSGHRRRQARRHRQHGRGLRQGPSRRGRGGRGHRQPLLRHRRPGAVLQALPRAGKGVYVLVKTSNPSSAEIQDLLLAVRRARSTTGWPIWWTSGAGPPWATGATAPSARWWEARTRSRGRLCASAWPACPSSSPDTAPREPPRPTWPRCSTPTARARWSTRRGPSSTPTRRRPSKYWVDAARDEAAAMRAALWQAAGRA